jgi:hypothetical protein
VRSCGEAGILAAFDFDRPAFQLHQPGHNRHAQCYVEIPRDGHSAEGVIRQSTTNQATEIKHPGLGQIAVGAEADVAVLRLEH